MSSFPLTGKHSAVDCKKCHGNLSDDTTPADAFPAPKSRTYLQMKDIPHTSCTDCHDDVHNGSFGRNCTQCHSTADWRTILKTAEDFGFHDKTKFPLRGMHTDVACKTCHGPFGAQKAVFKGLKHDRCTDCHTDAHVGQLDKDDKGAVPCEKCHTVSGFLPVLFDLTAHARTRFALDGSHKAVACNACHTADEKMARRVPAAVKARLDFQRRRLLVSDARLELPNLKRLSDAESSAFRCESCHENPHADQFDEAIAARGCNGCHLTTTFRDETFRHDDSRFPLTGKHAGVACGKCHAEESLKAKKKKPSTGPATMVRYRPIAMECATCHADEHVGQLARDGSTDCKRCHQTTGFSPSTFRHDDPAQTRFVLEGKHKEVKCARCHVAVHVPGVDDDGKTTARYKPIATDCRSCHDDEHNGGFDRFTP